MTNRQKWALYLSLFTLTLLCVLVGLPRLPDSSSPQLSTSGTTHFGGYGHCVRGGGAERYLDRDGEIAVLVWNIHKQGDGQWPEALWSVASDRQLMLLQEVGHSQAFSAALTEAGFQYANLTAFRYRDLDYGVMTVAGSEPIDACGYLATEPWLRLPKGAIASRYALSNGQRLLVVNLHGINFSLSLVEWQAQLLPLFRDIAAHKGPVILAGDFNSWGQDRSAALKQLVGSHGLQTVQFEPDSRIRAFGSPLDWLFYRDLKLTKAQSPATELSDHAPLLADFTISWSTSGGGTPGAHQ